MSTKALLKQARDKLNKKDFAGARDAVERVLDFEPSNYTAHVFLAVALLELGENDRSEKAYQTAMSLEPDQLLARQGLVKFYERTSAWDRLVPCLLELADAYLKGNDVVKLAETLQRLLQIRRTQGTKLELVDVLLLFLPGSRFHALLSTLPEPNPTNPTSTTISEAQSLINNTLVPLEDIVAIIEKEEEAKSMRDFNTRRTRLGAPKPDVLKRDIDFEICDASKLPGLYNEVLNHPNATDDLRLSTEAKLLRLTRRHLLSIPQANHDQKTRLLQELEDLVQGGVLLKRPDELAWEMCLEWQDYVDVDEIDTANLFSYLEIFPKNNLSEVLRAYLLFRNIHWLRDDVESKEKPDTVEEGLDALLNCPITPSDTILANRIQCDAYLFIEDYENASTIARQGLRKVQQVEASFGKPLQKTRLGFQIVLLTALVHLFPPKHHEEAMRLVDQVLKILPGNVKTLMAKGLVLQARKDWVSAKACFDQVLAIDADVSNALQAQEESAWCESLSNDRRFAISQLQEVLKQMEEQDHLNDMDIARCLWRIGESYWALDGRDRESAYTNYIAALKRDPGYAAAFTSLGIYYAEYVSPPDPVRASKCFQKAFELDPRETVAARRLAHGFANEQEWDLVEVIARRTIEGEGGKLEPGIGSSKDGDVPTNVWAWKALGVVELRRSNFPEAIHALHVALRAEPGDGNMWLRIGEAYGKAGRYAAAIKALEHAQSLLEGDWLPRYFIASAKQGIGLYSEAISTYEELLEQHPTELGLLISLAQSYLQLGITELNTGFRSRAETSFETTGRFALKIIESHPGFRGVAWKIITDATLNLSQLSLFNHPDRIRRLMEDIESLLPPPSDDIKALNQPSAEDLPVEGSAVLRMALRSAEYRIGITSTNKPDQSAWYDLGVTLQLRTIRDPKPETTALAIKYVSKAVQHDPGNDRYWITLGQAYFSSNPRAAQHCLVKALEIDGKNSSTWATLGFLYLHHLDVPLAAEAFQRAQVLDPDCTAAWIGQGLIAAEKGDQTHSDALFLHATSLDQVVPEADYETSTRLFKTHGSGSKAPGEVIDALLPAYYLLSRYCSRKPHDAAGLHLYALVCERLGHIGFGRGLVQRAIEILERVYEDTEDSLVERQFMIANATLGRLNLAHGEPEASLPSFESVLALVSEDDAAKGVLEIQARLGIGMGQIALDDYESALATFQEAQRIACGPVEPESEGEGESATPAHAAAATTVDGKIKGQTTIALAQMLWSLIEPDFREAAQTELLKCISEEPTNLTAIKTLVAMGILSGDEGLVDAAVSEIVALPLDQRLQLDADRNVDKLLIQYHLTRNEMQTALQLAEKSLFCRPSDVQRRQALASLLLKMEKPQSVPGLIETSGGGLESRADALALEALAQSRLPGPEGADAALSCAQRALMLRPGKTVGWKVLAHVRQSRQS
ncbi:superkiller protein 3 SKI3 [Coprinopsis marcescibilis]|uniref:Superkiller protein 3 SKI3 n=1 Tax=Coprinopsis marcescibilis TaxID=230819 RepID=A0A5C3KXV1_COPMA|nr:superkiller protein 3 SKI3 [Coprinopsis marcescibilis]